MNLANKITMFRIVLIPLFVVVLYMNLFGDPLSNFIACGIFIVASLTDFLDGYVARKFNMVTTLGKVLDPLADKLLVISALIILTSAKESLIPSWIVIIIISRELIITTFRVVAAEKDVILAAGFWGKLKTNVQMITVIYFLINPIYSYCGVVSNLLLTLTVFFTVLSGIEYITGNFSVLRD